MRLTALSTLLFISTAIAAPLADLSVTSVDVAEQALNAKCDENLLVTVTRVDDLVADDGSILAERVMAVKVTFDVLDNQLHCNGVPINMGVSNIQVEAQIATNADKLQITSEEDAAFLQDSFDIGLATVEVTATLLDEIKLDSEDDGDGMTFRRFAIKERVTEVNGHEVVQTQTGQQIIDVFEDGKLERWVVDPLTGFLLPGPSMTVEEGQLSGEEVQPKLSSPMESAEHAANKSCVGALVDPVINWWNDQSFGMQGTIAGGFFAALLAIVMGIRRLAMTTPSGYDAVATIPSSEEIWHAKKVSAEKNDEEEKHPFLP